MFITDRIERVNYSSRYMYFFCRSTVKVIDQFKFAHKFSSANLGLKSCKIKSNLNNYAEIMFRLHCLQKALLMVFNPFHTWLQNYGTLSRFLLERLTFLISSPTLYSMTLNS